jgi:hypothetical protein
MVFWTFLGFGASALVWCQVHLRHLLMRRPDGRCSHLYVCRYQSYHYHYINSSIVQTKTTATSSTQLLLSSPFLQAHAELQATLRLQKHV